MTTIVSLFPIDMLSLFHHTKTEYVGKLSFVWNLKIG